MKKKLAIVAMTLSTLTIGTAAHAEEQTYVPLTQSTMTRSEVLADLAAWRSAGLADEWHSEQTPDIESREYRDKFARYQQLRMQQQSSKGNA
ncbi:DUF4148 domain-containing protein [Bordetella sp. 02P26C-1]|uniref:DUF4148 domain-containing protein n=1 Tax=Bordetella sp. 02P26C-1 TaxID=2683195 RepID=UPI00135500AA|nr:DUF4148 domain-containing protein [Bordetella sp. 02P26C-1]MVW79071.1 DUF4148 domain-containing protein [Bordetella sp. 02P26C-1]